MGIDPKIIGNTFVKLDKLTNELVKQSDDIKVLTAGLANIVNFLQPELLCIGGGISRSGDILVPLVREKMRNKIYSRYSTENTKLVVAKLDNDAGIIGAAKLFLCRE